MLSVEEVEEAVSKLSPPELEKFRRWFSNFEAQENNDFDLQHARGEKIVFKTWHEANQFFQKHLKPMAYGPKGQPIFSRADMDALNVELPSDY